MKKIAVALSKGGVGKTTTAVNLAAGLARLGEKVLLIDVDTQGQVARALGDQPESGLAELMLGESDMDNALFEARPDLWLLSGGRGMAGVKRMITRKEFGGEQTLTENLSGLDDQFDFCIVDTGPAWDSVTINVLFYVDRILSPVSLEVMTLQGLMDFAESLKSIQKYHSDLELKYIVPTFFDRRVKKSDEILEQLDTHFGTLVCDPIRYNVRLSEAPGYGQTIFEYSPGSAGAMDYKNLSERIMKDD